ncbi:uncharacterized protein LOC117174601 [Belonocnema kinseyi]|uniref:uncharacterized protein LOC117174601 n=1 Tax=Belonocnema kinseyi TaxID=2817044 RepID=UPI00143DBA89|nr:uncharacterized protein LOC117174601 [Belonocnema kinseyi]
MDYSHRRRLDAFCEVLIPHIDMTVLWPYLIQNRIYDRDDVNVPVWKKKLNDLQTIRDIFLTIKTRGPEAYENLLLSLRQSEHDILAEYLEYASSESISRS